MSNDAVICGQYRYVLRRAWPSTLPARAMTFIMLNPSTADAVKDDPTIRRCIGFAKREGCNAMRVLNLFAFRSPNPEDLRSAADPVGPENDRYLRDIESDLIVCAWGACGFPERVRAVMDLLGNRPLHCLGLTSDGHPRHPLYVRSDAPLEPYALG